MPDSDRNHLRQDLEKADDVKEFLNKLLSDQWQQRTKYFGRDIGNSILSYAIIRSLDPLWVDHLTALDDLRDGVRLRGYAQRDPLIEYRKEGYDMFQGLMRQFESNLARMLFRLEPVTSVPSVAPVNAVEGRGDAMDDNDNVIASEAKQSRPGSSQPVTVGKTISRNDPCWCGSGKKWKKCHYPEIG